MVFHLTKKKKRFGIILDIRFFCLGFFRNGFYDKKINVKKQRRYDRSTTILKLNDKIFFMLSYNQL